MVVSLDHCMWFHRRFAADHWLLFDQDSRTPTERGDWQGASSSTRGPLVASSCKRPRKSEDDGLVFDRALEPHARRLCSHLGVFLATGGGTVVFVVPLAVREGEDRKAPASTESIADQSSLADREQPRGDASGPHPLGDAS